ncbi:hypothetical protein CSKR_110430 [Clonorchis sinensis]|uniref:ATP-binding cassette transporter n=1 Tax=Clonorchis sinensis TaxID=79923 RepID=A0A3R7H389_CLOSI|nr:hypothetical protein CSKR_110430 [Clonorchis sinensis]
MQPGGSTRAGILPSCPSLDRGSREAEVGFEPRTFRSVTSRSNHLSHLTPRHNLCDLPKMRIMQVATTYTHCSIIMAHFCATNPATIHGISVYVRGSNPTSASRLLQSGLRQPGSISLRVLPLGGMTFRHRKATECAALGRLMFQLLRYSRYRDTCIYTRRSVFRIRPLHVDFCVGLDNLAVSQPSCFLQVAWQLGTKRVLRLNDWIGSTFIMLCERQDDGVNTSDLIRNENALQRRKLMKFYSHSRSVANIPPGGRWLKWLEREVTDRKVRGSNPTSASRLSLSRLGQPGSIPALVFPSGCMAARHKKGVTPEQLGTNHSLFRRLAQESELT